MMQKIWLSCLLSILMSGSIKRIGNVQLYCWFFYVLFNLEVYVYGKFVKGVIVFQYIVVEGKLCLCIIVGVGELQIGLDLLIDIG